MIVLKLRNSAVIDRVRWYALKARLHAEEALELLVTEALDRNPDAPKVRPLGLRPPRPLKVDSHGTLLLYCFQQAEKLGVKELTIPELVQQSKLSPMQVRYALNHLEDDHVVQKRGKKPFLYSLING